MSEFDSSRSLIHSLLEQQGKAHREKKGGGGNCLGKNSSVGDLRQFDADLDFNFHIDADLDLDWIRILLN